MPTKVTKKYLLTDSIILDEIYPLVESAMNNDSPKTFNSIKKAIEKFEASGCKVLGVALNKVDKSKNSYGYYKYGKEYGYYSSNNEYT